MVIVGIHCVEEKVFDNNGEAFAAEGDGDDEVGGDDGDAVGGDDEDDEQAEGDGSMKKGLNECYYLQQ